MVSGKLDSDLQKNETGPLYLFICSFIHSFVHSFIHLTALGILKLRVSAGAGACPWCCWCISPEVHQFVSNDTRKLTADWMSFTSSSSPVIFTWPVTTARHSTFFIWGSTVDFTSSSLATMFSGQVSKEGNLPALLGPGPGFCLIRDSEAKKASFF